MDLTKFLIQEVQKYDLLYNLKSPQYKNTLQKEKIWAGIAARLRTSTVACKNRWKSLRDLYKKYKRSWQNSNRPAIDTKPRWRYYDALTFLDDVQSWRNMKKFEPSSNAQTESTTWTNNDEKPKKIRRINPHVPPEKISAEDLRYFETCSEQLKGKHVDDFHQAARMSVDNFDLLLSLLEDQLQRHSNRHPIDPETRLSVTILYLAQGCCIRFLAWSFQLGVSTIRKVVYETCDSIWEELCELVVAAPVDEEWTAIANNFYAHTGLPNCLGAIDTKQVKIVRPKENSSAQLYCNYKNVYSTVLVGACDCNYSFSFVDVVSPCCFEDSGETGVFGRSNFGKKIVQNLFGTPAEKPLPDTVVGFPYFFVGESSLPLRENLLRPFSERSSITEDKQKFNDMLSHVQAYSENTFGILAYRWRILTRTITAEPENVNKIILAAVALHNFLIHEKDPHYFFDELVDHIKDGTIVEGSWRHARTALASYKSIPSNSSSDAAFGLRNYLKDYLLTCGSKFNLNSNEYDL